MEDVLNGNRLAFCLHPARSDHHGQPLDEIAENLEGGRSGSDDHRGTKGCHRHVCGGELLLDFAARAEVDAQVGAHFAEAAQVDDPRHPGPGGSAGEGSGQRPIASGVFTASRLHGMDEIIGRRRSGHVTGESILRRDVTGDDLNRRVRSPRFLIELPRCPNEASNPIAGLEEGGHEPPPDIPRRPGDKNGLMPAVEAHRRHTGGPFPLVRRSGGRIVTARRMLLLFEQDSSSSPPWNRTPWRMTTNSIGLTLRSGSTTV